MVSVPKICLFRPTPSTTNKTRALIVHILVDLESVGVSSCVHEDDAGLYDESSEPYRKGISLRDLTRIRIVLSEKDGVDVWEYLAVKNSWCQHSPHPLAKCQYRACSSPPSTRAR